MLIIINTKLDKKADTDYCKLVFPKPSPRSQMSPQAHQQITKVSIFVDASNNAFINATT